MFKKNIFLVLFFLLFLGISVVKADECCPDDPDFDPASCNTNGGTVLATGCGGGGPAPQIPIDGGATAFAGLAVAYGINQLRKKKNR